MARTATSHRICPFCHTPAALTRYEVASDGEHTCQICPECDYTLLMAANSIPAADFTRTVVAKTTQQTPIAESLLG